MPGAKPARKKEKDEPKWIFFTERFPYLGEKVYFCMIV